VRESQVAPLPRGQWDAGVAGSEGSPHPWPLWFMTDNKTLNSRFHFKRLEKKIRLKCLFLYAYSAVIVITVQ